MAAKINKGNKTRSWILVQQDRENDEEEYEDNYDEDSS